MSADREGRARLHLEVPARVRERRVIIRDADGTELLVV